MITWPQTWPKLGDLRPYRSHLCEFSPRGYGEDKNDRSRLRVRDLGDSTHSGPEDHGHVKVQCHPRDGLADSLQDRYRL